MSFTKLLIVMLSVYVLLNFLVLPRLKKAWRANRSVAKISKAGLLGAVQLARDTAFTVSLVYCAFAVVVLSLGIGSSHSVTWLEMIVNGATKLHASVKELKDFWDGWFVVVLLLLIVYISWRKQRDEFCGRFEYHVDNEFDRLNRERDDTPAEWAKLDPDEHMRAIDEQLQAAEAELNALNPSERAQRQALRRRIVQLREHRQQADYERRICVDAIEGENRADEKPSWRRFFLSKGLFSDLKGLSKVLSRATLALLALAMIGVAAHAGLTKDLWSQVIHLDDLRVEQTKTETKKKWDAGESKTAELTQDDRHAIAQFADDFARALLRNPNWRSVRAAAARPEPGVQQSLVRHAILEEVRLPNRDGTDRVAFADTLTPSEREVVADVANGSETRSTVGQVVADREGPAIKSWLGSKWEGVKAAILQHAERYHEPLSMQDVEGEILDHVVSASFDGLAPDFPYGEVGKQARSVMSSAVKKAVHEAVTTEFHRVVEDLAKGTPYKETIDRVATHPIAISKANTQDLLAMMQQLHVPNENELRQRFSSDPGTWRSPDADWTAKNDQPKDGSSAGGGGGTTAGPDDNGGPPRPGIGGGGSAEGVNTAGTTSSPAEYAARRESIIRDVAREETNEGQYSLREEAVDALAEYEDHFPRSVQSQTQTPLGHVLKEFRLSGDAAEFARATELKVMRAESFSMLRGFSRVGGVLIGQDPENPKDRADVSNVTWTFEGNKVRIRLTRASGKNYDFGPFEKSLVHQALAYAADGRPVAVTMTTANPVPELKIHLHPSLVDSPLGCRVAELDRLVDTYAGSQLKRRSEITKTYQHQLAIYNFAWAVRVTALADAPIRGASRFADGASRVMQSQRESAATALKEPGLFAAHSVFSRKPAFFDRSLIDAMESCKNGDVDRFKGCLHEKFAGDPALKNVDVNVLDRWLASRASFEPWSGVRERQYRVTSDLSFLSAPSGDSLDDELWPFDFIVQIAFTSAPINLPDSEQDQYVDKTPIEFDEIKPQIHQLVEQGITRDGMQPMFQDLRNFTILERMFRTALTGRLGEHFPLYKLATLTSATAGEVPYFHTARWNGSTPGRLRGAIRYAVIKNGKEAWMQTAASRALACGNGLYSLGTHDITDAIAKACDFGSIRELATRECKARPDERNPACMWYEVVELSRDLRKVWYVEQSFGVLQDAAINGDLRECPSLSLPNDAARQVAEVKP